LDVDFLVVRGRIELPT